MFAANLRSPPSPPRTIDYRMWCMSAGVFGIVTWKRAHSFPLSISPTNSLSLPRVVGVGKD